jgi:hypothetical protein
VFSSLALFGGIAGGLLGFGVGHFLGKTWKSKRRPLEALNIQERYLYRLQAALSIIHIYSQKKMHVKSFIALLERAIGDFRPAFVLQIHNVAMRCLICKLVGLLSKSSIHTALLDSVLQLEHEILEESFPSVIAYRLRLFYIPLYVVLKKPPEESHQQLEFVNRIEQILNSAQVQRILQENEQSEGRCIEYLLKYPSLCLTSKYHLIHSMPLLIELDTYRNLTISYAQKKRLGESIIRRSHSDAGIYNEKSLDALKRHIVEYVHNTYEEFDARIGRSPISRSSYDVDLSSHHRLSESLHINRMPTYNTRPRIITILKEHIYDGDMNELVSPDESEAPLIVNAEEVIKSRKNSSVSCIDKRRKNSSASAMKFSVEKSEHKFTITEPHEVELKVHKYQECFDELLQLESEPTTDKEWKTIIESLETKIYQKKLPNSPLCVIKAFCIIPYPPEIIFTAIWDTEIRTHWDNLFQEFRVVSIQDDFELLYYMIKTPIGITKRDWLQKRILIRDYPGPGCICLYFISVEDDSMPPKPKVIRAETLISGYIIRPTIDNKSVITIITSNDIKGLIPSGIVNRVAAKAPLEWVKSLIKGCEYVINK